MHLAANCGSKNSFAVDSNANGSVGLHQDGLVCFSLLSDDPNDTQYSFLRFRWSGITAVTGTSFLPLKVFSFLHFVDQQRTVQFFWHKPDTAVQLRLALLEESIQLVSSEPVRLLPPFHIEIAHDTKFSSHLGQRCRSLRTSEMLHAWFSWPRHY